LGVPVETDADTIETDRLVLRRWRESDAARLYDIQSRVDIVQWISDDFDNPRLLTDVDDARGRIARYQETFAHPPQGI
jgi:RimJ/RimL family protein N-acetyltransferase